jgi:hypothetical protein
LPIRSFHRDDDIPGVAFFVFFPGLGLVGKRQNVGGFVLAGKSAVEMSHFSITDQTDRKAVGESQSFGKLSTKVEKRRAVDRQLSLPIEYVDFGFALQLVC